MSEFIWFIVSDINGVPYYVPIDAIDHITPAADTTQTIVTLRTGTNITVEGSIDTLGTYVSSALASQSITFVGLPWPPPSPPGP